MVMYMQSSSIVDLHVSTSRSGHKLLRLTFQLCLHLQPQWLLTGPLTPSARSLNHQKLTTTNPVHMANQIVLLSAVRFREEKMRWSRTWPAMSTANQRVGSCMSAGAIDDGSRPYVVVQISNTTHDQERHYESAQPKTETVAVLTIV